MPDLDRHTAASPSSQWLQTFADHWTQMGPETKDAIVDLLPDDWTFEDKRVLDFGSGPGRTLKEFLPEAETGEFWGVDIDRISIDTLEATLCPPMHAAQCGYSPPLEFATDSFDLALGHLGLHPPHRQLDPLAAGAPSRPQARRFAHG